MTRRLRTAHYSKDERDRLARAVATARQADGHRWRPDFARAIGISARSLAAVEGAEATVGQTVLEAIGRGLARQGWTEHTPRAILDGEDPPQRPHNEITVEQGEQAEEGDSDAQLASALHALWGKVRGDRSEFWKRVGSAISEVQDQSDTDSTRVKEDG